MSKFYGGNFKFNSPPQVTATPIGVKRPVPGSAGSDAKISAPKSPIALTRGCATCGKRR